MGEIADDMINGFSCQHCGQMIDGEEPGYPRSCDGCGNSADDEQEMKVVLKEIKQLLKANGLINLSERNIAYGYQFRFVGGAILNLYYSGKIQIQGTPHEKLNELFGKKKPANKKKAKSL